MKVEPGEQLKPKSQYVDEAIQLAISGRWEAALDLNRIIAERFGTDEETHNRIGKALTELGRLEEAKTEYDTTLSINPLNVIARKNTGKLESLMRAKEAIGSGAAKVDLNLFVEEMGKTVTTTLEDSADPDICAKAVAGDLADLRIDGDTIVAETVRGVRLGVVESKLARRLIKFMQGGNRYQGGITSCEGASVKLIIRETYQDPKFGGKPSFPMRRKREVEFRPYAREAMLTRDPDDFQEADEDEDRELEAGESGMGELEGLHTVEDDADTIEFADESDDMDSDEEDDE